MKVQTNKGTIPAKLIKVNSRTILVEVTDKNGKSKIIKRKAQHE